MPVHTTRSRLKATAALAVMIWAAIPSRGQDSASEKRLAAVQAALAGGSAVQKRVRIDTIDGDKEPKVAGVYLLPPFNLTNEDLKATEEPDAKEAEKKAAKKKEDALLAAMRTEVTETLRKSLGDPNLKPNVADIRPVYPVDHPHIRLQELANAAGAKVDEARAKGDAAGVQEAAAADQCKFDASWFDASGSLVVAGIRGPDKAVGKWLDTAIDAYAKSKPAALAGSKAKVPVTDKLTPVAAWTVAADTLQKLLAESDKAELRRLRVDRVYLAYDLKNNNPENAFKNMQFRVEGVRVGTDPVPGAEFQTEILNRAGKLFTPGPDAAVVLPPSVAGLVDSWVDERVGDLRKAVAEKPALDGVRIDPGLRFGPAGELLLAGLQPSLAPDGESALKEVVHAVFKEIKGKDLDRPQKLATGAVSTANMTPTRTAQLLAAMRKWLADPQPNEPAPPDETRLSRLYFNKDGTLTLECDSPHKTAKDDAGKRLKTLAEDFGVPVVPLNPKSSSDAEPKTSPKAGKGPENIRADFRPQPVAVLASRRQPMPKKVEGPDPAVVASSHPIEKSLVAALQQMVLSEPGWENVLIRRGVFVGNQYVVSGVVEKEEQRDALAAHLKALEKNPTWANYFRPESARAPNKETMPVIPMAELVRRARRVMPGYRVFDGIRVVAGRYEAEKGASGQTLVFDAHVVGRLDPGAETELARMIAADEKHYGLRVAALQGGQGRPVRLNSVPSDVTASDQLGNFTEGLGALALARGDMKKAAEWLDVGMLHASHLTSVWFLDAYYNHLKGDTELVRRDLLRMIELEDPLAFDGPNQRKRRYWVAKDLQGPQRDALEKFWLKCWKEYKDGTSTLTFTEPKAK